MTERYDEFLSQIPKGDFYSAKGTIVPFHDKPYSVRLSNEPNEVHDVYLNGYIFGNVTTDADGEAVMALPLKLGENTVEFVSRATERKTTTYITTRNWATWLASVSDVMAGVDASVGQIKDDRNLDTCSAANIESVWGRRLRTANLADYTLSTYRDILRNMYQAYRQYGGKLAGIMRSVAAITQINPLVLEVGYGPEWILGTNYITNDVGIGGYSASIGAFNKATTGAQITPTDYKQYAYGISTLKATFDPGTRTLKLVNEGSGPVAGLGSGTSEPLPASGPYNITIPVYLHKPVRITTRGPWNTTAGKFLIEIDGRGILEIAIPTNAAYPAATLANNISTAIAADARYAGVNATVAVDTSGTVTISLPYNSTVTIHHNSDTDVAPYVLAGLPNTLSTCVNGVTIAAGATGIVSSNNATSWPTPGFDGAYKIEVYGAIDGVSQWVVCDVVSKTNDALTIRNPNSTYPLVIQAAAYISIAGQLPFTQTNYNKTAEVSLSIDDCADLVGFTDLVVTGATSACLPDGWELRTLNNGAEAIETDSAGRLRPVLVFLNNNASLGLYYYPHKRILDYRGFKVNCGVWVSRTNASNESITLAASISFDGGATWTSTNTVVTNSRMSKLVGITAQIPLSATKIVFRLSTVDVSGLLSAATLVLEESYIRVTAHTADVMGTNTIVRSEHRGSRGNVCYVWNYDQLNNSESKMLGLTAGTIGHLDTVAPAQIALERFNLGQNVSGVFTNTELSAGTLINMEVVPQAPARFSYLKPTMATEVRGERLDISQGQTITLAKRGNGDNTTTFVYEDGVSVGQDQYAQAVNGATVTLNFVPDPTKVYTIDYDAAITFVSAPINTPADRANFLWFADYFDYRILDFIPRNKPITIPITFDARGAATLDKRSDGNQTTATLTVDDGVSQSVVPMDRWRFVDTTTVTIDPIVLNTSALYTLKYISRTIVPAPRATIKLYIKTATTSGGLTNAAYTLVNVNDKYKPDAWIQFKVEVSGVIDPDDVKVYSMCLKGLDLYGAGVPVLGGPY